MLWQPAQAHVD